MYNKSGNSPSFVIDIKRLQKDKVNWTTCLLDQQGIMLRTFVVFVNSHCVSAPILNILNKHKVKHMWKCKMLLFGETFDYPQGNFVSCAWISGAVFGKRKALNHIRGSH